MDKEVPKDFKPPEILFRPLTKGLGFHPFTDGLPYAPVTKSPRATVPPSPVPYPTKPRESLTTGVGVGSGSGSGSGTEGFARPVARISVPVAEKVSSVEKAKNGVAKPTALPEKAPGFLYLFKRMFAYLLDILINSTFCGAALFGLVWVQDLSADLFSNSSVVFVCALFLVAFNWMLITAQEMVFKTSIGKLLFRLTLRGRMSLIFLRAVFFLLSIAFFGFGLFWSVLDRKKWCWHDRLVGICPIEIARL